jgi:hypothetical protein
MIFTIVTIIFLPLSFCVGFFGMNAIEINEGLLPLSTELKFMLPISAGITLVAFLFAFSTSVLSNSLVSLMRSTISFGYNTALTWVMVKTGLYMAGREMSRQARRLQDRENKITGAMKAEVMRKEKNMEKMRAAGHVRQLAAVNNRSSSHMRLNGGDGDSGTLAVASGRNTPFSPYTPTTPGGGGHSPYMTQVNQNVKVPGVRVQVGEMDVELGERRTSMRRIV